MNTCSDNQGVRELCRRARRVSVSRGPSGRRGVRNCDGQRLWPRQRSSVPPGPRPLPHDQALIVARDGALRATLTGHTNRGHAVAIAPDGTWLATASADKTARIWAADGALRATLTGHTAVVDAAAIAADGTWLATAGRDNTARIWAASG